MRTIRPDCGGIWGTGTYGQRQYAGHRQCGSGTRTTRPDCGGIYATGTYGQRYYAGHIQCRAPYPTRPDCGGIYGTGAWGMRYYGGHRQCGYVPPTPPVPGSGNKGRANRRRKLDEELDELLLILMLWNAIPRQGATNKIS